MKKEIDYSKEGVSLNYGCLMFEITRRCNLRCKHCFRGEAQNIDMSYEIIDKVLNQVGCVNDFSVTGGEPFLAPDTLNYLIDGIIKRKIECGNFSLVVNGTILDDRAIKSIHAINKIGTYIYENIYDEFCKKVKNGTYSYNNDEVKNSKPRIVISISVDEFHDNDVEKAIEFYSKYINKYVEIRRQDQWIIEDDGKEYARKEYNEKMEKLGFQLVISEGNAEKIIWVLMFNNGA